MTQYIIRRLIQLIPVLIGVTLLVFLLMHLTPGNPAKIIVGEHAPPETIKAVEKRLGLDKPLPVQYMNFVKKAAQFDFGVSMCDKIPVKDHIFERRFFITLELAIYSTIFSIFLGLIAGIVSAVRQYSIRDVSLMVVALFGLSMPNFWLGIILIQFFTIKLGWFPPSGWGTPEQIIMPVITLGTGEQQSLHE